MILGLGIRSFWAGTRSFWAGDPIPIFDLKGSKFGGPRNGQKKVPKILLTRAKCIEFQGEQLWFLLKKLTFFGFWSFLTNISKNVRKMHKKLIRNAMGGGLVGPHGDPRV